MLLLVQYLTDEMTVGSAIDDPVLRRTPSMSWPCVSSIVGQNELAASGQYMTVIANVSDCRLKTPNTGLSTLTTMTVIITPQASVSCYPHSKGIYSFFRSIDKHLWKIVDFVFRAEPKPEMAYETLKWILRKIRCGDKRPTRSR
jgi:hypothetical protein